MDKSEDGKQSRGFLPIILLLLSAMLVGGIVGGVISGLVALAVRYLLSHSQ